MGKKRKVSGSSDPTGHGQQRRTQSIDSKVRVNTYEDVADSEDEFHINRDKILLEEGPAQKRQRRAKEDGTVFDESADFFLRYSS